MDKESWMIDLDETAEGDLGILDGCSLARSGHQSFAHQ